MLLDTSGRLTGTTMVPIAGSLIEPSNPSQARRGPGEQAVSMMTNTGAGLDSLRLFCAPTTCGA